MVESANYIDDDGTEKTAWTCNWLSIVADGATLNSGWYVVDADKTFNSRIKVNGDVKFILADGKTLTTIKGIAVNENNTLTIYGQSGQTGILNANSTVLYAAIGGDNSSNTGTITINGGHVTAQGGSGAAGIGGAIQHDGGIITINGGVVYATGGEQGAGIGGGAAGNGGTITINGGTVTAQGGGVGTAGIGGGVMSKGGTITINGGVVNAIGESNATGIGNEEATITLNWTNLTDSYRSTTYEGTVTVETNKFFTSTDGTILSLSGTVNDNSILAGKTLVPRAAYNINTICNIDEFSNHITLSETLAFSDSIVTVTITPVDKYTCFVSAIGATSGDEITLNNSGNSYTFTMLFEDVNLYVDFKIPYLDLAGVTQYATAHSITNSTTSLGDGWYAVTSNVTNSNRIQAEGDVNIILCDGVTMTNSLGINTYDGKSLNFWGQRAGTGTWQVTDPVYDANGIGDNVFYYAHGYISFNGGTVRVQGGTLKNGIRGETITLYGGTVRTNSYGNNVKLERFFSDDNNTIYEPKVYTYDNHGTTLDGKTLKPAGKLFLTEGEWSNTGNWYKGELPDRNDYVLMRASATIPDGCVAQVYRVFFSDNATLTIADGGQLIHSNAGVVATVEKSIVGHEPSNLSGWSFIASPISTPVDPSTTGLITDNYGSSITEGQTASYDLYYYDEPNELWKNYRNEAFYLNNGQGYLYANNAGTSISFEGTLNASTADPTIAVTASDNNLTGFNLVGNPFARNLSMASLAMETNGDYSHITAIYEINNGEVIINENPSDIPPCGGFFIQTNAAGTLHFNHAWPEGSSGNNKGDLRIEVSNAEATRGGATLLDRAYINFDGGNAIDKFMLNPDATKLYIPQGGKDFAIVVSEGHGEMPLNFRANEDGNYTISVNPEGVEMTYLHLIDNMTGADVDLLAAKVPEPVEGHGVSTSSTTSYTFNAKTTDYESRFKLVFVANGEVGPSTGSGTFAFINAAGNIIVDGEGTLQIIDVMGRVIACRDAINRVSTNGMTPGVYVLRLINGDDVKVQKIVVR